ncbi:hypothetical protein BDV40DRAFT_279980 [Aspergillus tamarii]|uniref:Uncharacterized protein n=1 Tax=Aspergillus tamarii TaxID=41984 RepID=A0A5N6UE36_ASPTM|nr:hypothetical protein BDV40DRAFT_279980 [Aspergillus tamarii]
MNPFKIYISLPCIIPVLISVADTGLVKALTIIIHIRNNRDSLVIMEAVVDRTQHSCIHEVIQQLDYINLFPISCMVQSAEVVVGVFYLIDLGVEK